MSPIRAADPRIRSGVELDSYGRRMIRMQAEVGRTNSLELCDDFDEEWLSDFSVGQTVLATVAIQRRHLAVDGFDPEVPAYRVGYRSRCVPAHNIISLVKAAALMDLENDSPYAEFFDDLWPLVFAHFPARDQPERVVQARRWLEQVLAISSSLGAARVQLPPPRLVRSSLESEEYAAECMVAMGFQDARVTAQGPDGGIDVWSRRALAQAKLLGSPVGAPALQALYGLAALDEKQALLFSASGYTRAALEFGFRAGMALFSYSRDGSLQPVTQAASELLAPESPQVVERPDYPSYR